MRGADGITSTPALSFYKPNAVGIVQATHVDHLFKLQIKVIRTSSVAVLNPVDF